MASTRLALRSIFRPRTIGACHARRAISISAPRQTDGVFRALTEERVQTPWIEAWRKQQSEGNAAQEPSGKPETPADRDLTPRTMSSSYHSVVRQMLRRRSMFEGLPLHISSQHDYDTKLMDFDSHSAASKPEDLAVHHFIN